MKVIRKECLIPFGVLDEHGVQLYRLPTNQTQRAVEFRSTLEVEIDNTVWTSCIITSRVDYDCIPRERLEEFIRNRLCRMFLDDIRTWLNSAL